MDYEKAYKEAHSRAEMFRNTIYKGVAEEIFPDLRETSYGEKIRKELIEMVKEDWPGRSDVIAWLEKQSKASKVEQAMREVEEKADAFTEAHKEETSEEILAQMRGEQKPAENKGMNLVEEEMTPFQKKVFCIIDTTIEEEQGLKQVCDELFALASTEIKQKSVEWSEEDETILKAIILNLEECSKTCAIPSKEYVLKCIIWLKSLKERVQPQPKQEWNEEDESIRRRCIGAIEMANLSDYTKNDILDWLKSLRPNHWKPSEERMEAPQKVCIYISGPISGYDLEERRKAFMEIEERLKAQGYETVNPMKNGLPDEATTHEHMKRDIELLLTCDRIYFMKKWTHSKGCKVEFDVATAIGLPVMFEEAIELTEFCKMITFE